MQCKLGFWNSVQKKMTMLSDPDVQKTVCATKKLNITQYCHANFTGCDTM